MEDQSAYFVQELNGILVITKERDLGEGRWGYSTYVASPDDTIDGLNAMQHRHRTFGGGPDDKTTGPQIWKAKVETGTDVNPIVEPQVRDALEWSLISHGRAYEEAQIDELMAERRKHLKPVIACSKAEAAADAAAKEAAAEQAPAVAAA